MFTWTPADEFINTTNPVTVIVTDNGLPPLSDSKTFSVLVETHPFIQSIAQSNGAVTLVWTAIAGQNYRGQYRTNLTGTNWADLSPDVTASGPSASLVDPAPADPQRFYHILVLP